MLKEFDKEYNYKGRSPFPYYYQDDILDEEFAKELQKEIMELPLEEFDRYNNPFEQKYTYRDKSKYPKKLQELMEYLTCEDKITLTPYVIYIGKNTHIKSVNGVNTLEIKYYFYINTELFINISSKMYDTLESFISDIDKYQKRYPKYETDFLELSVEKEADGVTPLNSDILTDKKNKRMLAALQLFVFPSSNELITTLIKSVISRLSDNVKKDYLELLKKKKTSNTMTTFEYFCYYAMLNLLNNETNILLSR